MSGRNHQELLREFLLQRFLARVFQAPGGPWVLKGGTGLLIRLPGARHSQDIDLLHTKGDLGVAMAELHDLAGRSAGDGFTFRIQEARPMLNVVSGVQVAVDVYVGTAKIGRFPIDLSTELHLVAQVEFSRPVPVIEMPDLPELPEFVLYPLPDQVADKVCAMYERHGPQHRPSSRYRDLVDLLLIITHCSFDATLSISALTKESRRRNLNLPASVISPAPAWNSGYTAIARASTLPAELRRLADALPVAQLCLDPLLANTITAGTWDPDDRVWRST